MFGKLFGRGEKGRPACGASDTPEHAKRHSKALSEIEQRVILIEEIGSLLSHHPEMTITALRKPEAQLIGVVKHLGWQIEDYRKDGISKELIDRALSLQPTAASLLAEVQNRIADLQAKRPIPKPRITQSRLSQDQKAQCDALIAVLDASAVLSEAEIAAKHKAAFRAAFSQMKEQPMSYGEAMGFPIAWPEDDVERRAFRKKVDQDIEWQIDVTWKLFEQHLQKGQLPAPHYPGRILILLRKARDFDRERDFIRAWRRHFPDWWVKEALRAGLN